MCFLLQRYFFTPSKFGLLISSICTALWWRFIIFLGTLWKPETWRFLSTDGGLALILVAMEVDIVARFSHKETFAV